MKKNKISLAKTFINPGGVTIWLTGLSGCGKSTIADALAERLQFNGCRPQRIDGDVIRQHLKTTSMEGAWLQQRGQGREYKKSNLLSKTSDRQWHYYHNNFHLSLSGTARICAKNNWKFYRSIC
jgi:ABC-type oligopeptide transport system ATPase subunit